jgi:hypothetical protein
MPRPYDDVGVPSSAAVTAELSLPAIAQLVDGSPTLWLQSTGRVQQAAAALSNDLTPLFNASAYAVLPGSSPGVLTAPCYAVLDMNASTATGAAAAGSEDRYFVLDMSLPGRSPSVTAYATKEDADEALSWLQAVCSSSQATVTAAQVGQAAGLSYDARRLLSPDKVRSGTRRGRAAAAAYTHSHTPARGRLLQDANTPVAASVTFGTTAVLWAPNADMTTAAAAQISAQTLTAVTASDAAMSGSLPAFKAQYETAVAPGSVLSAAQATTATPPDSLQQVSEYNPNPAPQRRTAFPSGGASGMTGGTVAGISIGVVLVGLAVAMLAIVFIKRRQAAQRRGSYTAARRMSEQQHSPGYSTVASDNPLPYAVSHSMETPGGK